MRSKAEPLRVGSGTMPETEMGPLIRPAHRQRMASYIDRGIGEGAALVVDGRLGRYWLPRYQWLTNLISAHSSRDGRCQYGSPGFCFLVGSIRYYGDLPATGTDAFVFYPERCVMTPHWWSE